MDEEESRKSTRNRKKRSFGDDFLDPTTSEFTAGSTTKRKKECPVQNDVDCQPSPPPPAVRKESEATVKTNISKILANYTKQQQREDKKMKEIEEKLMLGKGLGEPSRRRSERKNDREEVEEEDEDDMEDLIQVEEKNSDDKNYRPPRPQKKKSQLSMGGLQDILKKFPQPAKPAPPPVLRVSYSYSSQLTAEEDRKLDEEASALIATIKEANTLKILAKRHNGKIASGGERESQNAEIKNFVKTAEPSKIQDLVSRSTSRSLSPLPTVRRSDRQPTAKNRVYSPEPEGAGRKKLEKLSPSRKSSAGRVSDALEAPEVESTALAESSAADFEIFLDTETSTPSSSTPSSEEPKPDKIEDRVPPEQKPENLLEFTPVSEEKPSEGIESPVPDLVDADDNPAPECAYSPKQSAIPPPIPIQPQQTTSQYPPGSTTEVITIVRGPDGRILSKKRVITKNDSQARNVEVRRAPEPPKGPIVYDPNRIGRIPTTDMERRSDPEPQKPKEQRDMPRDEREEPIRRWRFPISVLKKRTQPAQSAPRPPLYFPQSSIPLSFIASSSNPIKLRRPTVPNQKEQVKDLDRSTSPQRLFLGAEEPHKDLSNANPYKFTWFTQKKVTAFGKEQLRRFGKMPVVGSMNNEYFTDVDMDAATEEDERHEGICIHEKLMEVMKLKREREEETIRQKKAMAKKLIFNEAQVYKYMNSEKFKESLASSSSSSEFNKLLNSPVPLQKIPEFSETLSQTNPKLFENLTRIRNDRLHKENPKRYPKVPHFQKRWNDEKGLEEPEYEDEAEGEEEEVENSREAIKDQNWIQTLQEINARWDGLASRIPTVIDCHLCQTDMRLCVRRTRVGGVMREYPVYRCPQKRCQTFRSIRKTFDISTRGLPPLHPDPSETSVLIHRVELKEPKVEPLEQLMRDALNRDDDAEDSEEDAMVPMGRQKRITKSNLDHLSKDFICETSASEIAKKDHQEVEEHDIPSGFESHEVDDYEDF